MDNLRTAIAVTFGLVSMLGAFAVFYAMFERPIVLLPVGAALCGFISYFLMERERGITGEKS